MFSIISFRSRCAYFVYVILLFLTVVTIRTNAADDRPELSLRARPKLAFAPVEIMFTGLIRGGEDDNEDFYCVSAEWDWDDGTKSESIFDCEPYVAGASEIRRRFSRRHSYAVGGAYDVRLTLKRRDDVVASARVNVDIRGGRFRSD